LTSTDHTQLSTIAHRLATAAEDLARMAKPATAAFEVADAVAAVHDLIDGDIDGDVGEIRAYAAAFDAMSSNLADVYAELTAINVAVPKIWTGIAASDAVAALTATEQLLDDGRGVMIEAATQIDNYAAALPGLRDDLAASQRQFRKGWHEITSGLAQSIVEEFLPWTRGGGLVDAIENMVSGLQGAARVYARWALAVETLDRGFSDVIGKARAQAAATGGLDSFTSVRLANAALNAYGVATDDGILSTAQLTRVGNDLGALSPADRATMAALLTNAHSDVERAYLLKALIAGHSVAEISAFDHTIHSHDDDWLRAHLNLINPNTVGPVTVDSQAIAQQAETTCGSMSIILARATNDPIYALALSADPDGNKLVDMLHIEEQRVHDETNTLWPQALGTTPWGVTDVLNRSRGELGTTYGWHIVDDTDASSVGSALSSAVSAVDAGYPVPVLIGNGIPRHYVLLVGHDDGILTFYNPSGSIERISEADFLDGNVSELGYQHVQAVITPT
jgi:hypothetical protein